VSRNLSTRGLVVRPIWLIFSQPTRTWITWDRKIEDLPSYWISARVRLPQRGTCNPHSLSLATTCLGLCPCREVSAKFSLRTMLSAMVKGSAKCCADTKTRSKIMWSVFAGTSLQLNNHAASLIIWWMRPLKKRWCARKIRMQLSERSRTISLSNTDHLLTHSKMITTHLRISLHWVPAAALSPTLHSELRLRFLSANTTLFVSRLSRIYIA